MKALPPAPERKLLTDGCPYYVGCDFAASGDDFSVVMVEKWFEDGRYQRFLNGELVEDSHYYYRPPFVMMRQT